MPAQDVALNLEQDYKTLQKMVAASQKAAVGYRESIYALMATVYSIGLKYENDPSQIDAKLYEMNLGPAPGEKKRGKAAPFWNKLLKLTFAQKTEKGWDLPKEDSSRISKYGKMLTNAETSGVDPNAAKDYFSAGLQRRIAGTTTKEEEVATPTEQLDEAVEAVRGALSGLNLNVPVQDVLRAVLKAERVKVSKVKEGESLYAIFGEIADKFGKFIEPKDFVQFSTEEGTLTVITSFNDFDSNQLKFECPSPADAEWNFVLNTEGLRLLKNLAKNFADVEWSTEDDDFGRMFIFARTTSDAFYKAPKSMLVGKERVGFYVLKDDDCGASFKEPDEKWSEVDKVDDPLRRQAQMYGVIDSIEECEDLLRFVVGDWTLVLPKARVVEGESQVA